MSHCQANRAQVRSPSLSISFCFACKKFKVFSFRCIFKFKLVSLLNRMFDFKFKNCRRSIQFVSNDWFLSTFKPGKILKFFFRPNPNVFSTESKSFFSIESKIFFNRIQKFFTIESKIFFNLIQKFFQSNPNVFSI